MNLYLYVLTNVTLRTAILSASLMVELAYGNAWYKESDVKLNGSNG